MNSVKDKFSRWFIPGFMLVSSMTLLIIGVPRFLHELMLVPGTPILHRVNAGEAVTAEELTILEQSRLDALNFVELPDAYSDLGSSYFTRARMVASQEARNKFAEMAIEASMKSLNMAPLNTFAWLRVATAHIMLGPENYKEALEAWRNSIATARFEPFVLFQRVHLGTILYQEMTDEDINTLKDQLGMAYRWNRGKLRQYVRDNQLLVWMAVLCEPDSEMKKYLVS